MRPLNLFTTFHWELCVIRRREYPNPRKWIHPLDGPKGSPINDYAHGELACPASIRLEDIHTHRLRRRTPLEANPSLVVDPGGKGLRHLYLTGARGTSRITLLALHMPTVHESTKG